MPASKSRIWSLVALLARAGIGTVFLAYGYDKLQNPEAVQQLFTSLGVPRPELAVTVVTWVELGGGLLLIAGLALPVAGTLLAGLMLGAWWFTQRPEAVLVLPKDNYELELALAAGALLIGFSGGGAVSFDDAIITAVRRARSSREDPRLYTPELRPDTGQIPSGLYPDGPSPTGQWAATPSPTGQWAATPPRTGQFPAAPPPTGQFRSTQAPTGQFPPAPSPTGQYRTGQFPAAGRYPTGQYFPTTPPPRGPQGETGTRAQPAPTPPGQPGPDSQNQGQNQRPNPGSNPSQDQNQSKDQGQTGGKPTPVFDQRPYGPPGGDQPRH